MHIRTIRLLTAYLGSLRCSQLYFIFLYDLPFFFLWRSIESSSKALQASYLPAQVAGIGQPFLLIVHDGGIVDRGKRCQALASGPQHAPADTRFADV